MWVDKLFVYTSALLYCMRSICHSSLMLLMKCFKSFLWTSFFFIYWKVCRSGWITKSGKAKAVQLLYVRTSNERLFYKLKRDHYAQNRFRKYFLIFRSVKRLCLISDISYTIMTWWDHTWKAGKGTALWLCFSCLTLCLHTAVSKYTSSRWILLTDACCLWFNTKITCT